MNCKRLITTLMLCAGVQLAGAQGFIANIDAAQDGGGGRTGSGQVYLYLTGTTLSISNGTYSGLSGTVSAAHIHGPALPGVAAGVLYNLVPTFITTGGTSGTIAAGNLTITASHATSLAGGLLYINIHTTTFGGGEIRGQIVPVPEPSAAALCGLGIAGFVMNMRRRQRPA